MDKMARRETKAGTTEPRKRPTPVRGARAKGSAPPPGAPTRDFTVDGEAWVARHSGGAMMGVNFANPAPVLEIEFYASGEPEVTRRRTLASIPSLEDLPDEALEELFRHAAELPRGADTQ